MNGRDLAGLILATALGSIAVFAVILFISIAGVW